MMIASSKYHNCWTASDFPCWMSGDTLLFDFDAEAGSLAVTHKRSGITSTVTGIPEDVYPYFGMGSLGESCVLLSIDGCHP